MQQKDVVNIVKKRTKKSKITTRLFFSKFLTQISMIELQKNRFLFVTKSIGDAPVESLIFGSAKQKENQLNFKLENDQLSIDDVAYRHCP